MVSAIIMKDAAAASIVEVSLKDGVLSFITENDDLYAFAWSEFIKTAIDISPENIHTVKSFVIGGTVFHYLWESKNFIVESPTGKSFSLADGLFFNLLRLHTSGTPRSFRLKFPKKCFNCSSSNASK